MYYDMFVIAYLFFLNLNELLVSTPNPISILDVGCYDVNGNLRDVIALSNFRDITYNYTGIDLSDGPNVDIVVGPEHSSWPFQEEEFDIVTSLSALEHDAFFWETFTKMVSLLKDGGLLYINVPANFPIHRFPVDNWRFLPDSAGVLQKWAARQNQHVDIIHSSSIDMYTLMIFRKRLSATPDMVIKKMNRELYDYFVPMQRDSLMNIKLINAFLRNTEVESEKVMQATYATNPQYRYFPLPYKLLRDIPKNFTTDSKCRTTQKQQLTQPIAHINQRHYLVPISIHIPTDNITPNVCSFEAQYVLVESDMISEENLEKSIGSMLSALFVDDPRGDNMASIKNWILSKREMYPF